MPALSRLPGHKRAQRAVLLKRGISGLGLFGLAPKASKWDMVHSWSKGESPAMIRGICPCAGLLLIALCLSGTLLSQTKVQPATPTGPVTVAPSSASASDSD